MLIPRALLSAVIGLATAGCAADSIFPPRPPASFCDYPVTGALGSISVADLETVTAAAKPHKIYGVEIENRNALSIQITPTRHGSESLLVFKRARGKWEMTGEIFRISWLQFSTGDEASR